MGSPAAPSAWRCLPPGRSIPASIIALAVSPAPTLSSMTDNTRMPCGACRQVMMEFMAPDAPIWIDGSVRARYQTPTAPFKL